MATKTKTAEVAETVATPEVVAPVAETVVNAPVAAASNVLPPFSIDHEVTLANLPAQLAKVYYAEGNSFAMTADMVRSSSNPTAAFQLKFVFPELKSGVAHIQLCIESYIGAASTRVGENVYHLAVPFSGERKDKPVRIKTNARPLNFYKEFLSEDCFKQLSAWTETYMGVKGEAFNLTLEGEDMLFFSLNFRAGKDKPFSPDPLQVGDIETIGVMVEGKNYGTKKNSVVHPMLAAKRARQAEATPTSNVPRATGDDVM